MSQPRNPKRIAALEAAKRELLYSLLAYGLPVDKKVEGESGGLAYDDHVSIPGGPAVLTGHAHGLITVNVAEADDAIRVRGLDDAALADFARERRHWYVSLLDQ